MPGADFPVQVEPFLARTFTHLIRTFPVRAENLPVRIFGGRASIPFPLLSRRMPTAQSPHLLAHGGGDLAERVIFFHLNASFRAPNASFFF
ncbi:hypothetical protein QS257_18905 [Terrilactibacillus sp. S3-3]|nr:hypothetical protein QS257_18905 [Terrilactibacillus sp. S3-3]